jgi:DNA-binding HxlR family transcriptional regulator
MTDQLTVAKELTTTRDTLICPVARTAEIISGKWTLLIIRDLTTGTKRFSELERSLAGISPKTLSERLTALECQGVLRRQTYAEVPPKVEYSLTEKGQALVQVIDAMRSYGNRWLCCAE